MQLLATNLWQLLVEWDHSLFRVVNTGMANPVFDAIMPFMRDALHWLPLYVFVLSFVLINFGWKGVWWVVFFAVTISLCDMTGTRLLKYTVMRTRPCNNPEFWGHIRLLVTCPIGYSFTSNHAANHFGMAIFFFISFRRVIGSWVWLAILWAAMIAFAQVYVGIHYPGDVAGGFLLGLIYGSLTGWFFNKNFGLPARLPAPH